MTNNERPSWQDQTYAEIYEAACAMVRHRRHSDPAFTLDALRGLLNAAYAGEADGWLGKTTLQAISESATIAAYEAMVHEWQSETEADT